MFIREALRFSVQSLWANKVRSFLTALGLVIGNASVILVVTISITSREIILDKIRGIGSNLIYAQYEAGTNTTAKVDADLIKVADVEAVRKQLEGRIVAATGVMTNYDRMRINGKEQDIAVIGSDDQYPLVRNLDLLAGRFLDSGDVALRQKVALLTEKLAPDSPKVIFARARTYVEEKRNLDQAKVLLKRYLESKLTPEDPSREEAQKLLRKAEGA